MKEYFIFYIILVVLIVLLIFVVLLYTGYHSRTIVPGLLSTNHKLDSITNDYKILKISPDTSTTKGSILFGSGTHDSTVDISFVPVTGDERRRLIGSFILLLGSNNEQGNSVTFRIRDQSDQKTIGDPSEFFIPSVGKWGLTPIKLSWKSKQTDSVHDIVLEAKSTDGKTIDTGDLLLNSAYITYR